MRKEIIIGITTIGLLGFVTSANAILIEGFENPPNGGAGSAPVNASSIEGDGAIIVDTNVFAGSVTATEGSQFIYLTTFNPTTPANRDLNNNTFNETDFALMNYQFNGVLGSTLSFDYNVLTGEITEGVQDIFAISLDGNFLVTGAIGALTNGVDESGDFPIVTGFSGGPITSMWGDIFGDGQLGWSTYSTVLTSGGVHTLTFYAADEYNQNVDTALLVDNIQLSVQPVPEPTTMLLFGTGLLGLAGFSIRRRKK